MSASRKSGGSYRDRCSEDIMQMVPADFVNPWNFFKLFSQNDNDVYKWCQRNGLLATSFPCPVDNCSGVMATNTLSRAPGGMVFRCSFNRTHTRSSRTYSFFDRSNLCLQDIILFIKSYLERNRALGFQECTTPPLLLSGHVSSGKYSRSISITTSGTGNCLERY